MAHAQKPDFVFRRNGRVHLNRRRRQFSQLLAVEVCASAVVMLDTPCSEVVRRVLATHSIRHFPFHFPSRASLCAITFQLGSKFVSGKSHCDENTQTRGKRPSFTITVVILKSFTTTCFGSCINSQLQADNVLEKSHRLHSHLWH
jgi:hypothetical protein